MTTETDTKPVMDYIKASLPLLTERDLVETSTILLEEIQKRKKKSGLE